MKRDIRKEIINTSKRLFNERGFNDVTIRDIADTLGISSGNLTYHFNKKEEIIEAILALDSTIDTKPTTSPQTLDELYAFLLDMQQVVQENAFYFWNHAQLSQISPQIKEHQKMRYLLNVNMLHEAFLKLCSDGIMRSENFIHEYDRIIDTLLLSSIYWIPFSKLNDSQLNYQIHAWSVIYNLFTDKGKKFADKILNE